MEWRVECDHMTADGLHWPDIDPQYQAGPGLKWWQSVLVRTTNTCCLTQHSLSVQDSQPVRVETYSHVVSIQARPGHYIITQL